MDGRVNWADKSQVQGGGQPWRYHQTSPGGRGQHTCQSKGLKARKLEAHTTVPRGLLHAAPEVGVTQQERPRGGRGSAQGCVQAGIGVRLSVTGDDLGGQSARPSGWGPETRPQPPCSHHGASMGLVVLEGCGLQPAWRPPSPRAQEPLA